MSTNKLNLPRASSSGAVYGKDIALAINDLVFLLSIVIPPRKVSHTIPSMEIKEEQPISHRLGKGGSPPFLFSHQTSNDITVDVPSAGPWKTVTQGKPDQISPLTMKNSMYIHHTRPYGLNYPLSHGRNGSDNPPNKPAPTPRGDRCPPTSHGTHYGARHAEAPPRSSLHPHRRRCPRNKNPGSRLWNTENLAILGDLRAKSKK
ncbi:hypothetical protein ACLOJK_005221 [Asimina triloba]